MKIPADSRIVLAGSVNSSRKTLEKLIEHEMNVVGVLGLHPERSNNVSGYVDLREPAQAQQLPFHYFSNINDQEVVDFLTATQPDLFFVIGLSQLVKEPLLSVPTIGCIGFHPTELPAGRGRGAVAWLILGKAPGAATFFLMGEDMDDGPILAQQPFDVGLDDYAQDVVDKIVEAIGDCLDGMLPPLKRGQLTPRPQNHARATYLGKRNPEDGLINWLDTAAEIHRLIRATSSPLPGAYTYYGDQKIVIQRAVIEHERNIQGVAGRILAYDVDKGILVQTGQGLLWLSEVEGLAPAEMRIGKKLGLDYERELLRLKRELAELKARSE